MTFVLPNGLRNVTVRANNVVTGERAAKALIRPVYSCTVPRNFVTDCRSSEMVDRISSKIKSHQDNYLMGKRFTRCGVDVSLGYSDEESLLRIKSIRFPSKRNNSSFEGLHARCMITVFQVAISCQQNNLKTLLKYSNIQISIDKIIM